MSITKRDSYEVEKSSKSGVGTGLMVAGGGSLLFLFLASFIPFFPILCVLAVIVGVALKF